MDDTKEGIECFIEFMKIYENIKIWIGLNSSNISNLSKF